MVRDIGVLIGIKPVVWLSVLFKFVKLCYIKIDSGLFWSDLETLFDNLQFLLAGLILLLIKALHHILMTGIARWLT